MKALLAQDRVKWWLAIVGTATILLVAAYTLTQQSTRLAANDLPLSTAQTIKSELATGAQPSDVVPTIKTSLRTDSSVFVTITDSSEHVLASSATLDGQPSLPPAGTFAFAKTHGSDHFTWQPKDGIRIAAYVLSYGTAPDDGFIIAGQSLKQAEDRIGTYGWLTLAAWLAVIAWASLILLLPYANNRKK